MQTIIFIGSISKAMAAKRMLEQQGIRAYVRHAAKRDIGCGYSLLIPTYTPQIAAVLRSHGFVPEEQRRDGG